MSKKKSSQIHKKKKLHPLIKMLMGLFAVAVLGIALTAYAYKDVSPLQEVAGASTNDVFRLPSGYPTPSQTSCTIVTSVVGISPCGKDSYRAVAFTCGDGTSPKPTVTPTLAPPPTLKPYPTLGIKSPSALDVYNCRSIASWMTKVAQVCAGHSSCRPTITPTISPKPRPSIYPPITKHPLPAIHTSQGNGNTHP